MDRCWLGEQDEGNGEKTSLSSVSLVVIGIKVI